MGQNVKMDVAMDNGAWRLLAPLENKQDFLEVSADIVERIDPIFVLANDRLKALGMTHVQLRAPGV